MFYFVCVLAQGQGAITERLRSFSMHDLTAIQGDETVDNSLFPPLPETQKKPKNAGVEGPGKLLYFFCIFIRNVYYIFS